MQTLIHACKLLSKLVKVLLFKNHLLKLTHLVHLRTNLMELTVTLLPRLALLLPLPITSLLKTNVLVIMLLMVLIKMVTLTGNMMVKSV